MIHTKDRIRQPNWQWETKLLIDVDLQLFGEGGDGGATGSAGADGAGDAAQNTPVKREGQNGRNLNPLANTKYGIQPDEGKRDDTSDGEPTREEWESLKKGRFASYYGEDVSNTIRDRLKNSKTDNETLGKLKPVLESLSQKYGVDASDIDGLMAAYTDDDSLYEEEALEKGVSVATLKSLKKMDRASKEEQAKQQAAEAEQFVQQHMAGLEQQAEALRQQIPGFDLREALQDRRFADLVSPNTGISLEDAYFALHHHELMSGMAKTAIQKTKESMSANIQSGMNRPKENGTRTSAPGLDVKTNPKMLTRADREEIRRRVELGEKIYF